MEMPVFEVHEPGGKTYRVWVDGRTEGFEEGAIIRNGILPLANLVKGLAIKARDNGLITAKQAADVML